MAVMVHHGGLDATTHHPANNLGNTKSLRHGSRHPIRPLREQNCHNRPYRLFLGYPYPFSRVLASRTILTESIRSGVSKLQVPSRSLQCFFTLCLDYRIFC